MSRNLLPCGDIRLSAHDAPQQVEETFSPRRQPADVHRPPPFIAVPELPRPREGQLAWLHLQERVRLETGQEVRVEQRVGQPGLELGEQLDSPPDVAPLAPFLPPLVEPYVRA